ncbi:acyl-CoA dehydrogenase family protein [Kibdelosporangium philippinense]|uniref:Acyl-CoA dehydrogenase family protein n=2 Tax=Kibdelosporangium philippinense TaxID=211113 RepID=A0ABS8Z5V8_9PSEU|nr:acyl-CoA dehydrogenase family protein [Kibdelosporangium philippinense]MCE7001257.1 acyl-CoA dehydrogenase family protein [Kibdelosporangium philippinense]
MDVLTTVTQVLRANAAEAERANRLSDESAKALHDAGLFRLGVPKAYGGLEADLTSCLEVVVELARACPSSSWIIDVSYGAQHLAARFPDRTRQELWTDNPDQAFCGSFNGMAMSTARVDGGQVVSGRWSWVSGCYQANWAVLAVPLVDEQNETVGEAMALVPTRELSIEDTWDMAGLRGTGSHTLVAAEVFVPDHRIRDVADLMQPPAEVRESLYHVSLGSLALTFAGTMLGAAEEIFDATMRVVERGKPMADSVYEHLADSPDLRANLANARTLIDSARLHLFRAADSVDNDAPLDPKTRARVRMDTGYASKLLRQAADLLLSVGGASSLATSNPVQRYWRDLNTAARHPTISAELSTDIYGRALVGISEPASYLV